MDDDRFAALIRSLTSGSSRREVLSRLASTALGLGAARPSIIAGARKRKNKPKFNEFGCVNVSGRCRGTDSVCCSGICQGRKPKKGKADRSRCEGHDVSTCQAGQQTTICGGEAVACTTSSGFPGFCHTTTGNAGFCGRVTGCFRCARDADCHPMWGTDSACIRCEAACAGAEFGGAACSGATGVAGSERA